MIFRQLICILLLLAAHPAHSANEDNSDPKAIGGVQQGGVQQGGVDIYINSKHLVTLSDKKAVTLDKIEKFPPEKSWNNIVISSGRKKMFLTDWQQKYKGSILTLKPENDGVSVTARLPHKTVTLPHVNQIAVFTDSYTKNLKSRLTKEPPTPVLNIRDGRKMITVSVSSLEANEEIEHGQHGWRLDQILEYSAKVATPTRITLSCRSHERGITISSDQARSTFLKLSRKNEWRAIVADEEKPNRKDWVRCKGLDEVRLEVNSGKTE